MKYKAAFEKDWSKRLCFGWKTFSTSNELWNKDRSRTYAKVS